MSRFVAVLFVLFCAHSAAAEEVIFEKRSLYRNINVTRDGDLICLKFAVREYFFSRQSCMDVTAPDRLVFPYTRMVFSGLLLNPEPKRALIIGLGGGSIPKALRKMYPDLEIDTVEIDPAVVDVAEEYFDFSTDPKMRVFEQDGRVFVKRALRRGDKYDYIILDAFSGEYIPEHLMTKEFFQEVKQLLTDDGVLTANTFSTSGLYKHETATYAAAFPWFFNLIERMGNRVVLTASGPQPEKSELVDVAKNFPYDVEPYGINLVRIARKATKPRRYETNARVLTDQYSPANLLNAAGAR